MQNVALDRSKRLNVKAGAVSHKSMQHVNVKQSRETPTSDYRYVGNRRLVAKAAS